MKVLGCTSPNFSHNNDNIKYDIIIFIADGRFHLGNNIYIYYYVKFVRLRSVFILPSSKRVHKIANPQMEIV